MAKYVTLKNKNGEQILPATTAEQVRYNSKMNVEQAIDSMAVQNVSGGTKKLFYYEQSITFGSDGFGYSDYVVDKIRDLGGNWSKATIIAKRQQNKELYYAYAYQSSGNYGKIAVKRNEDNEKSTPLIFIIVA